MDRSIPFLGGLERCQVCKVVSPPFSIPLPLLVPEDVSVHQLPAELLLCVLATIYLIVARDVLVQGTQEDHGHHPGEEEYDDERVENREPLDVGVRHALQDVVPSGAPADIVSLLELDRETVGDVQLALGFQLGRDGQRVVPGKALGAVFAGIGAVLDRTGS